MTPTALATLTPAALSASEGGSFNPLDPAGLASFLWTLLIFAISVPFIWKVVMGPIARALLTRDEQVSQAIATAERASAEAEAARAEVEVKLGEARSEAAKLLGAARERGEIREREIVEAAKQEAANVLESAREAIRAEQDKALSAIRREVVDLSLHAAEQVLGRKVDDEDTRRLVDGLVSATGARN